MRAGSLLAASFLAVAALGVADARLSAADYALWNTHVHGISQSGVQAGKVTKLALAGGPKPLDAYVVEPPGGKPAAAVFLFPDIKGWDATNTRLWADKLAREGNFLVVLPDWFRGDPFSGDRAQMGAWMARQPRSRVLSDFDAAVAAVKKAYPTVQRVGQQGFCWGGLYSVLMSSGPAPRRVDAAVGYHASLLAPADFAAVTGPVLLLQSDPKVDNQINITLYAFVNKTFAAKRTAGVDAEISYYPDMPHGYSLRGNWSDPVYGPPAEDAFKRGVEFLRKYLTPNAAAAPCAMKAAKEAAFIADQAPAKPSGPPAGAGSGAPKTAAAQLSADSFFKSGGGMKAVAKIRGPGATALHTPEAQAHLKGKGSRQQG